MCVYVFTCFCACMCVCVCVCVCVHAAYDPTQPQFTALDDILGGPLDPELAARNRQIMEDLGLRLNTGPYIEDLRVPMPVAPYNGPGTESV